MQIILIIYNKINNYNFFKFDKFPISGGILLFNSVLSKYLFIIKK